MDKFILLDGVAAPMNNENVDTDKILPAQFLKTIKRTGLGVHLFESLRYDNGGTEKPDFVLNQPSYRHAKILITGKNFGCGSSREHAPWALLDFGIRCVIAPSFADIFFANCFKNGILPVVLPAETCERLMKDATLPPGTHFTVDLVRQRVMRSDGLEISFEIDAFRKHCLLNGLDEIGLTLQRTPAIDAYEARVHREQRWRPAISGI